MRSGQIRIERRRALEVAHRVVQAPFELVEHAEVVLRDRLVGHQLDHALELRRRLLDLGALLVGDPEVEPRVRQRWILLLNRDELSDAAIRLAGLEERKTEIEPIARRARRQSERLFQLTHGFVLGRGILVERLAEVTVSLEVGGSLIAGLGVQREGEAGEKDEDGGKIFSGIWTLHRGSPSTRRVIASIGTADRPSSASKTSTSPFGQRILNRST